MSTHTPSPSSHPIVWSIASSDCSGHAGIQADLATFNGLRCHGCSVLSGITAQNSRDLQQVTSLDSETFHAQLQSLAADLPAKAIKIGLIADQEHLTIMLDFLQSNSAPVILDPVVSASTGKRLSPVEASDLLALLPHTTLFTPNLDEAEHLLDQPVRSEIEITQAAQRFHELGASGVLIKGGHGQSERCLDYLSIQETDGSWTRSWLIQPKISTNNLRGTGCTLASAVAAFIAFGERLRDAVVLANAYVHRAITSGYATGQGPGPVCQGSYPDQYDDFPAVVDHLATLGGQPFPDCGETPLGLYPVVDSVEWLERLLPLGVDTAQIRIKDCPDDLLEPMLVKAIQLGRQYNCRLFINDYWQLAIKHGAYGVHLGQEDIETADLSALNGAGIRLGISTHGDYEWARAASLNPSYLAIGAIYPTDTKDVHVVGLPRLSRWVKLLQPQFPLTAIGGINLDRLPDVLETDIDSVAVVSAITKAKNYEHATEQFKKALKRHL